MQMALTLRIVAVAGGAVATGCHNLADDPIERREGCPDGTLSCFQTADAGPDGGNPACSGDPTTTPTIVNEDCGVFVSASAAPGGTGTRDKPFATFADAAAVKPARVFACAGMYAETAQVRLTGGVEVYGGFTGCTAASWAWSAGEQAQLKTVADKPGVVLEGGANKLENVSVSAPAATKAGGSSIALLVNGGSLDMANGALTARDAQDGAAGASPTPDLTLDGAAGASGVDTCNAGASSPGALGATNTCATGRTSTAGNGGDGGDATGNPAGGGTNGTPSNTTQPTKGIGGAGEGQGTPVATSCDVGEPGANGAAGNSGKGAQGLGALAGTGYQGRAGTDGMDGLPGQGGGGGGGARGAMSVTCNSVTTPRLGASGGAGGTGGCGGSGGGAGQPGGSSIALLALGAKVTLTNVTLIAGNGGNGGAGGDGQSGGHGGIGGPNGNGTGATQDACPGGKGGQGGVGGPGGGGQGGHSLGIAFQGTTAPAGGTFTIDMTKNGKGGAGGTGNTSANMGKGDDGIAADCWDFGKNKACGP